MPTSIISGIVVDPSGTPQANTAVRARLVPKGATRISDNSTISEIESTTTNGTGNWSLTLEEQSNISPANSYYAVEEVLLSSSYNQYAISVPAADSNVEAVKIGFVTPGTPLTSLPILPGSHAHPEYEESTEITAAVTAHEGAANPHTVYATDADLTAHAATSHGTAHPDLAAHDTLGLATQVELDAHAAAVDPHPTYHTAAEVATDITTHAGLADPHTGYQKESEKGAVNGYASLDASTLVPVAQLATGAPNGTKFLRDDRTWVVPASGVSIPQQDNEPAGSVANDLWIDTNEGAGVGLSSIIGYAEVTANQAPITTEVDVTGLLVTVTVPDGRRIRISSALGITSSVNDDIGFMRIAEGGTNLAFAQAKLNTNTESVFASVILSPTAGSHTYKIRAARTSGTGNLTVGAASTNPAYILVEDITGTLWPVGGPFPAPQRFGTSVRRTAAQTISSSVETSISWDTFVSDTTGGLLIPSPGGGNTFTVPAGYGGLWAITVSLDLSSSPQFTNRCFINIVTTPRSYTFTANGVNQTTFTASVQVPLEAGQTISTNIFHNTGGASFTVTGWCHVYKMTS